MASKRAPMFFGIFPKSADSEWFCSPAGQQRLFWGAVGACVATIALLILGIAEIKAPSLIATLRDSRALLVLANVVIGAGVFGEGLLVVGMGLYWWKADRSNRIAKLMWLVLFIANFWFATLAYYFIQYLADCRKPRASATAVQ